MSSTRPRLPGGLALIAAVISLVLPALAENPAAILRESEDVVLRAIGREARVASAVVRTDVRLGEREAWAAGLQPPVSASSLHDPRAGSISGSIASLERQRPPVRPQGILDGGAAKAKQIEQPGAKTTLGTNAPPRTEQEAAARNQLARSSQEAQQKTQAAIRSPEIQQATASPASFQTGLGSLSSAQLSLSRVSPNVSPATRIQIGYRVFAVQQRIAAMQTRRASVTARQRWLARQKLTAKLLRERKALDAELAFVDDEIAALNKSRGSTADPLKGRFFPRNRAEETSVVQARAEPEAGKELRLTLKDSRWPSEEGWVKMQRIVQVEDQAMKQKRSVTVHYNYNKRTRQADDFKIVDKPEESE